MQIKLKKTIDFVHFLLQNRICTSQAKMTKNDAFSKNLQKSDFFLHFLYYYSNIAKKNKKN